MTAPMRGSRSARKACHIHGGDSCELAGEPGLATRTQDKREVTRQIDDDERCDCCDFPVMSCGKAVENRERREIAARRAVLSKTGYFPAIYDGTCEQCGERFQAGTLIRMFPATGWKAECCA